MDYAWLVFTKSYREVNNSTQNSHLKLVAGELKEIDGKGDELPERKKKEEEEEDDGAKQCSISTGEKMAAPAAGSI